jgi:hypothetical protein
MGLTDYESATSRIADQGKLLKTQSVYEFSVLNAGRCFASFCDLSLPVRGRPVLA